MQKKGFYGSYLLIVLAGSLWGTIGLFVKVLNAKGASPEYTTFLRMFFAFLFLLVIALLKEGVSAFKISRRMLLSCMLLGFISMSLNNLCYTNAVNRLGMALAAAMLYMAPIFTSIESKIFFHEKIGKKKIAALAVNVAGCILAATGGDLSGAGISLIGLLFGLGAALAYSTQTIFGRIATDEGSPFVTAACNFFFATVFTLVLTRPWTTVENVFDKEILLWGLLFGLIPTTIAYLLYFVGIRGVREASKVPVLCSVELVVATLIGLFVFGEHFSIVAVAGVLMIILSILLINQKAE